MKNNIVEILLKSSLSMLFLLCLLKMPYGYYQATRFMGMFGFLILAYSNYERNESLNSIVIIYFTLALLFQPFIKVALGRTIWNLVDVVVSIGLISSIFFKPNKGIET